MYDRHSTLTFWAEQIEFYIFQILSAESRENERQYDDGGEPQHGWWHYQGRRVQYGSGREEQLHGVIESCGSPGTFDLLSQDFNPTE